MHVMGSTEGRGRGSNGKGIQYGGRRRGLVVENGGFSEGIVSAMTDIGETPFWGKLCEESGHNMKYGSCIRCGADEE
jgi:hypothetical protein